jgi:tetratricopeptide (TPR) repeat protein
MRFQRSWFFFLLFVPVAAAAEPAETAADRRLAEILEAEEALREVSAEGAGEETLLLRAQRIADRYESFLAENPEHLHGWILCGKFLRSVGADRRAFQAFRRAASLKPDVAVVRQQLGLILAGQGEYRPALPHLLRAVELAPEEPAYRDDLGRFLLRFGEALEEDGALAPGRARVLALEAFHEAYRLEPESFDRAWRWAEAHADLPEPDWEGAAAAWEEVHRLAGSRAEREASRLQIARAWIEAGRPDRAEAWLDPVETPALVPTWESLRGRL